MFTDTILLYQSQLAWLMNSIWRMCYFSSYNILQKRICLYYEFKKVLNCNYFRLFSEFPYDNFDQYTFIASAWFKKGSFFLRIYIIFYNNGALLSLVPFIFLILSFSNILTKIKRPGYFITWSERSLWPGYKMTYQSKTKIKTIKINKWCR